MTRLVAIPIRSDSLVPAWRRWVSICLELGKARLSAMVVVTAAVGFVAASAGPIDWALLWWTVVGTALSALSANALNQCMEAERDARMRRTADRPLPAGRIGMTGAVGYGLVCGTVGVTILGWTAGRLPAALAAGNIAWYLLIYTPLKTRSTLNTLAGAVVGAVPPLIGWSAASGNLASGAVVLAAVLFVWQVPHFLALSWMYRQDYRRGGYRMLPMIDRTGKLTARLACLWAVALVPVTLTATLVGLGGGLYVAGALGLGGALAAASGALVRRVSEQRARVLFMASVIYLPLLLGLLVLDRTSVDDGRDVRLVDSPIVAPINGPSATMDAGPLL